MTVAVLVTPPEVPVIDIGYIPFLVEFDGPPHPAIATRMKIAVSIPSLVRKRLLMKIMINKRIANTSGMICLHDSGGAGVVGGSGGAIAWAVKVAVAVCAVTPSLAVTEVGATVQDDFGGAPEHASATA